MLRGADRAAFAVAFVGRLRRAGVRVGLTETDDLVRALGVSPPVTRELLYWTARVVLVRRFADLAVFDRVFAAVFEDASPPPAGDAVAAVRRDDDVHVPVPAAPGAESAPGGGLPWATLPAPVAAEDDAEDGVPGVPELRATHLAALAERPFEELDAAETERLGAALAASLTRWPRRRSRRHAADPRGRTVALRPTMARARHTGFEVVSVVRERQLLRPRRVVLLCDVSGSMRAQTAAYLQMMRAFATVAEAEVFAFATSLTRLTPALRQPSLRAAIDQASESATDRFGGTRIAASIAAVLDSHHGNALRGGLVIVASDGWDGDPPERMTAVMARLRRRAHRILWLNPRAGVPGFAPLTGGMAAALPFCDALLPAATFRDLTAAAQHFTTAPPG
ncbi:VWA domain-containing protein [Actinoplanes sp. NPDC051851]|uniref:vWA domain-containing protein n=1 Tax=Actinoplanes sp. NPDC051851 TaxID=3154753 RepID=UPI003438ECB7